MPSSEKRLRIVPIALAVAGLAAAVAVAGASAGPGGRHQTQVKSNTDAAVQSKLTPGLQSKVDSTGTVQVAVSLKSSAVSAAAHLLSNEHVATRRGVSLMIGSLAGTKLAKLASIAGVANVSQIQFKQTGSPTGNDPDVGNQPDLNQRHATANSVWGPQPGPVLEGAAPQDLELRGAEEHERPRREDA